MPAVSIQYQVPMRRQEQNPICWIACVAMIKSWKLHTSIGIGDLTGGYDPSNSCIPNPAGASWDTFYRKLTEWGFVSENPEMCPTGTYVENLLERHGPFMLTHLCKGFAYGPQHSGMNFKPNDSHAVVITGCDAASGVGSFNNPWGDVNQPIPLRIILLSMEQLWTQGIRSVAYMP